MTTELLNAVSLLVVGAAGGFLIGYISGYQWGMNVSKNAETKYLIDLLDAKKKNLALSNFAISLFVEIDLMSDYIVSQERKKAYAEELRALGIVVEVDE